MWKGGRGGEGENTAVNFAPVSLLLSPYCTPLYLLFFSERKVLGEGKSSSLGWVALLKHGGEGEGRTMAMERKGEAEVTDEARGPLLIFGQLSPPSPSLLPWRRCWHRKTWEKKVSERKEGKDSPN